MPTSAPLALEYCCSQMAMPALGGVIVVVFAVEGVGSVAADIILGADVIVEAGQSNDVVGGKVVQPHAGSVLVCTGYELGEFLHTHQPGPLAMALQVFWGSAA